MDKAPSEEIIKISSHNSSTEELEQLTTQSTIDVHMVDLGEKVLKSIIDFLHSALKKYNQELKSLYKGVEETFQTNDRVHEKMK